MKKSLLLLVACGALLFTSCKPTLKSMREPNARMEWEKTDFEFSPQVRATVTSKRIFMIDWKRLFKPNTAIAKQDGVLPFSVPQAADMPIIGAGFTPGTTASFALYKLMEENPGYDVIFYPSYTTKINAPIGVGLIYRVETVEVQARLAKIK